MEEGSQKNILEQVKIGKICKLLIFNNQKNRIGKTGEVCKFLIFNGKNILE